MKRKKFIARREKTERRDPGGQVTPADVLTCNDAYRDDDRDVVRCDDVVRFRTAQLARCVVFRRRRPARNAMVRMQLVMPFSTGD